MEFLAIPLVIAMVMISVIYVVQKKRDTVDRKYFNEAWNDIYKKSQSSKNNWFEVVVSGDKLLDEALKQRGYKGKTMGERMVSANRTFKDPDMVWKAHKVRNKLVHESKFNLDRKHVALALRGFRKGLKDLDVL